MINKGAIDRDTIAVLEKMKCRALTGDVENIEVFDVYAAMYCGALAFARDRRLINSNAARRFYEQFKKDFEKLEASEIPARKDSDK